MSKQNFIIIPFAFAPQLSGVCSCTGTSGALTEVLAGYGPSFLRDQSSRSSRVNWGWASLHGLALGCIGEPSRRVALRCVRLRRVAMRARTLRYYIILRRTYYILFGHYKLHNLSGLYIHTYMLS